MKNLFCSILFISLIILPTKAHAFDDIAQYDWAAPAIYRFAQLGIVHGIGSNQFAPSRDVRRAEVAKILVLTFNLPHGPVASGSYSDTPSDHYAYQYIESLRTILPGASNRFRPDEPASREDIIAATIRSMGLSSYTLQDPNILDRFIDHQDITPALIPLISTAVELGIIHGYTDNTLGPRRPVIRAESVVVMNRALDLHGTIPTNIDEPPTQSHDPDPAPTIAPMRIEVTSPLAAEHKMVSIVGNVYAHDTSGLYVLVNGIRAATTKIDGGLQWRINSATLGGINNEFEAVATALNGEQISTRFTITYASSPHILLNAPQTTQDSRATIQISVQDDLHNIAELRLNGTTIPFTSGNRAATASREVLLNVGDNLIKVEATNIGGAHSESWIIITRGEPSQGVRVTSLHKTPTGYEGAYTGTPIGTLAIKINGQDATINSTTKTWSINMPHGERVIAEMFINGMKVSSTTF